MRETIVKSFFFAVLFLLFFVVIMPALVIYLNNLLGLPMYNISFLRLVGLLFVVGGVASAIYCVTVFGMAGKGTPAPFDPPKYLVNNALYRYTRNPMYLSGLTVILGQFFLFGYILLLFYFLFACLVVNFYILNVEEPELKKRFGERYLEYIKEVPRWFPKIY